MSLFDNLYDAALHRLVPAAIPALLDRLEETAATAGAEQAHALAEGLETLTATLVRNLGKEARKGLSDPDSDWKTVFDLGSVDLCYQYLEKIANQRETVEFLASIADPKFTKILRALLNADCTSTTLSKFIGETLSSTSRKLAELRQQGLTESHRRGKEIINFLTPAAKSAMQKQGILPLEHAEMSAADEVFDLLMKEMDATFIKQATFTSRAPKVAC